MKNKLFGYYFNELKSFGNIGNIYQTPLMSQFHINKIILFIAFTVVLTSCSSRKNILFNTQKEKDIPKLPVYVMQEGSDSLYTREQVIQPGDQLAIRNLQNEALISGVSSGQGGQNMQMMQGGGLAYQVETDSTVLLPVIGKVKLGGLNRMQAQEKLNKLYKKDLLKDPIITLSISNLRVTFLGEFGRQGNFLLQRDQVHLVQMMGEAGGLNQRADKRRIKIIRGDLKNPEVFIANLEDINSLSDNRLFLRNNDVVYAEPRKSFQVLDRINPTTSLLGIGLTFFNIYLLISNLK